MENINNNSYSYIVENGYIYVQGNFLDCFDDDRRCLNEKRYKDWREKMRKEIYIQRKNLEELRKELIKLVAENEGLLYQCDCQKIDCGQMFWRNSPESAWELLEISVMDVQELNSEITDIRLGIKDGRKINKD